MKKGVSPNRSETRRFRRVIKWWIIASLATALLVVVAPLLLVKMVGEEDAGELPFERISRLPKIFSLPRALFPRRDMGPIHKQALSFYDSIWPTLQAQWIKTEALGDRSDDPTRPILVLDPDEGDIHLEGPETYRRIALPDGWDWQVVRWTNDGSEVLETPVRLRIRTEWSRREDGMREKRLNNFPEEIELQGIHRLSQEKVSMRFSPSRMGYSSGFMTNFWSTSEDSDGVPLLVDEEEYQAAIENPAWLTEPEPDADLLAEDYARFLEQLRPRLTRHMSSLGYKLHSYRAEPSADFKQGIVDVTAFPRKRWFLNTKSAPRLGHQDDCFDLKYLGGSVWALIGGGKLNGENLVVSGAPDEDPSTWDEALTQLLQERDEWIRNIETFSPELVLTDGTKVELIAVCDCDKPTLWWRPDGTPLDWIPYEVEKVEDGYNSLPGFRYLVCLFRTDPAPDNFMSRFIGSQSVGVIRKRLPWRRDRVKNRPFYQRSFRIGEQETEVDLPMELTNPAGRRLFFTAENVSLNSNHRTEYALVENTRTNE